MSFTARRLLVVYLLFAAVLLACGPSAASLARQWSNFANPTYTHGFALAASSAWLIFRSREEIARLSARPSFLAGVALLGCTLVWLVLWRASLQSLHDFLLPAMLWLAVCTALGGAIARRLLMPIALLYLAVPVWDVFAPLLQWVTVQVVGGMLTVAGVRNHVEGILIVIPEGVFQVIDACSGVNLLVAGLALAGLAGEIHRDPPRTRVALLALMAGLSLLTNWLRVFVIVFTGHLTNMQHPLVREGHYTIGWLLFAAAAMGFVLIARRLPEAARQPAPSAIVAPAAFRPVACAVVLLVLAIVPAGMALAHTQDRLLAAPVQLILAPGRGPWQGPTALQQTAWQPVFVAAQGRTHAVYRGADGSEVEAFVVLYRTQKQGAELIGYDNSLAGPGLTRTQVQPGTAPFEEWQLVDEHGARSLIWFTYTLEGRPVTSAVAIQLRYGLGALTGAPPRSGLVAFRSSCAEACDAARAALQRFTGGIAFERTPPGSASLFVFRGP